MYRVGLMLDVLTAPPCELVLVLGVHRSLGGGVCGRQGLGGLERLPVLHLVYLERGLHVVPLSG